MNPTPRSNDVIQTDIVVQIANVDAVIQSALVQAKDLDVNPADMRFMDGTWVLTPLLAARAQLILAEVMLRKE